MAASLAVVVPVALAIYSGWQQHKTCAGEPYAKPIAENFCSGLRQTLNESCTAMLSMPLGQVSLGVGETITPVKFDEFTKETIRETYSACTDFWDDKIGFPEYRRRLSEHASVLNLLFARLPPSLANQKKKVLENLSGLGASSSAISAPEVQSEIEATCQKLGSCGKPGGEKNGPDIDAGRLRKDWEAALAEHEKNVKDFVTTELADIRTRFPKIPMPVDEPRARLVAEVTFETGDATLSKQACAALASPVRNALKLNGEVLVTAYADYRGDRQENLSLSQRRADKVAACVAQGLALPDGKVHANGAGVLWTLPVDARTARRASIYVRD